MEQLRNYIVDQGLLIRTRMRAVSSGDEAADAFERMYEKNNTRFYQIILDLNSTEITKIVQRMVSVGQPLIIM